jgi:uncharacterized protein YunC (DUF1805 family)
VLVERVRELEELIRHCWVHSGYADCGAAQMDSAMRLLYDTVIAEGIKAIEKEEQS